VADIFISYARSPDRPDKAIANKIKKELERLGLSVFLDVANIDGGENFNFVIDHEVKHASVVVGIWSTYGLSREWLRRECQVGMLRNVLVPVLIEDVPPLDMPIEFLGMQWVDFLSESEDQWAVLIRSIARILGEKGKALVDRFTGLAVKESPAPLIAESTTVESTNVRVVLDDMSRGRVLIPDYQRDSNQWDYQTKSLFIETVINNLAVPALFFEPRMEGGRKVDDVVDGQQRLTTLQDFRMGRLRLVSRDDAPYISPNSSHYAGRLYDELPETLRETFESYRLPIIKLHNLGDMRLEVFRRINQGGAPLSAQDIRLAYYGSQSPTVAMIRIVGIHDTQRASSQRFFESAGKMDVAYPWTSSNGLDHWRKWWFQTETSKGQKPSEMFLIALVSAQVEMARELAKDPSALALLRLGKPDTVDEALDMYCAKSQQDDVTGTGSSFFFDHAKIAQSFFPYFASFFSHAMTKKRLDLPKTRLIATVIGASYSLGIAPEAISEKGWTSLFRFFSNQRAVAQELEISWPESKGQWGGVSGSSQQMVAARSIIPRLLS
jgi:hypothetical protein